MFQAGAVTTGCLLFLQFVPKQPRDTSHFEDPQLAEPSNLKLSSMPQSPPKPSTPNPSPGDGNPPRPPPFLLRPPLRPWFGARGAGGSFVELEVFRVSSSKSF